ncbi:MAG: hypothetical protein ACRD21_18185 [Vicinamibacteria bacterium]
MQRPNENEFLAEVLAKVEDLPEGFAARFAELLETNPEDRADAIRRLIEEHAHD